MIGGGTQACHLPRLLVAPDVKRSTATVATPAAQQRLPSIKRQPPSPLPHLLLQLHLALGVQLGHLGGAPLLLRRPLLRGVAGQARRW